MKKVLSILFLIALFYTGNAQSNSVKAIALTTTSYGNVIDTVLSTATKVTTPFRVSSWGNGVTAQVVITKISGTVGGSLGLYGSMNGTNWTLIGSASTPSDGSANYSFNTVAYWYYYQISYTGSSGQSASFKSYIAPY